MESKKLVYGIGLPRTGTKSLASALRLLGFSGENHCKLTNFSEEDKVKSLTKEFIIDNHAYEYYEGLVNFFVDESTYFILTIREFEEWDKSVKKISNNTYPNIEEYTKSVIEYFKKNKVSNKLLIIDFKKERDPWEKLCTFLDEDMPNQSFPYKK